MSGMTVSIEYTSFLIRLWREVSNEMPVPCAKWHAEVEHIQTGAHWSFEALEELLAFLHQEATNHVGGIRLPS